MISLPNELLAWIFTFLPSSSVCSVLLTCKRFNEVADQALLWRSLCRTEWKYWHHQHDIENALTKPIDHTDWKRLFILKRLTDRRVARTVEQIIADEQSVNSKIWSLVGEGYDAKDELIRIYHSAQPNKDDGLARKYWAETAIHAINRDLATSAWRQLRELSISSFPETVETPLIERAIAAFDMFVVGPGSGDFADMSRKLDECAEAFLRTHSVKRSTRETARDLAQFLRTLGFHSNFSNDFPMPEICSVGAILARPHPYPSHKLTHALIYTFIAHRIGLNASLCAYRVQNIVAVYAPDGMTVDGGFNDSFTGDKRDRIYIDNSFESPSTLELRPEYLKQNIKRNYPVTGINLDDFLKPANLRWIVIRFANAMARYHVTEETVQSLRYERPGTGAYDPDGALSYYSHLLARMMFTVPGSQPPKIHESIHFGPFDSTFVFNFIYRHPWELNVLHKSFDYIWTDEENWNTLACTLDVIETRIRRAESRLGPKQRNDYPEGQINYRIGQLFTHARSGVQGFIFGWKVYDGNDSNKAMERSGSEGYTYYECL
jgi:F-box protein 21